MVGGAPAWTQVGRCGACSSGLPGQSPARPPTGYPRGPTALLQLMRRAGFPRGGGSPSHPWRPPSCPQALSGPVWAPSLVEGPEQESLRLLPLPPTQGHAGHPPHPADSALDPEGCGGMFPQSHSCFLVPAGSASMAAGSSGQVPGRYWAGTGKAVQESDFIPPEPGVAARALSGNPAPQSCPPLCDPDLDPREPA